jgi:hypothetical protein
MEVATLAEMVLGDGKYILKHWYDDDKHESNNKTQWPKQQKPDKKDLVVWKEWIALLVVNYNSLKIRQPLGRWKGKTKSWQWWKDESQNIIYQHTGKEYREYEKATSGDGSSQTRGYLPGRLVMGIPTTAQRTNVCRNSQ